jgi:asparagine synthase (glutamine-hydrolysing)
MCGIAAILQRTDAARQPDIAGLGRMAAALGHRGPDDSGVVAIGRCGLAHTRLSIIDVTGGRQPMTTNDLGLVLSYNGEVFNYIELRSMLTSLGRRFRTKSDTEVVLQAYAEWGEEAFARFNGQFAIAIWDARRERLVLARDRLGVRPLYTCEHAGRVYVASEVKAIFAADRSIPRAIDPFGIDETFTFWSVVAPRTAFAGVEELRPGYVRTYDRQGMREHAFWSPSYSQDFDGTLEDAAEAVREGLTRATSLRMLRADVPVGAYLSGGLDSSLIAALARRATSARFSTFSLRFEDAEFDETAFQRSVAKELETEHHEVVVARDDIARIFPEVIAHAERPILRSAPAPLMLLSRLVRQTGIKVVLTGEGADEMFGGYDIFREAKVRRFWARHPGSKLRPRLLERLYPYLARSPVARTGMAHAFFAQGLDQPEALGFAHDPRWRTTSALKRLLSRDVRATVGEHDSRAAFLASLPRDVSKLPPLSRDQYIETRTLLSSYLLSAQGDRVLMGSSVEGRFPFLDTNLVALASSLPPSYKLRFLDEKHVLKRAAAGLVPKEIIARTKQPFRAPDALSFVSPKAPAWIAEVLDERAVARAGIFDPPAVARLFAKCRAATDARLSNADNMALVGVLSTQLLHRIFVDDAPETRVPVVARRAFLPITDVRH